MKKIEELIKEYCPNGVEYKKINDISIIKRGKRITKKQIKENGKYPIVSGGTSFFGRFDEFNRKANTITISSYGSAGYVNYITEDFWANDVCLCVYPKDYKKLNNKYLYYCLKNNQNYLYKNTTKAIPDHIETRVILELKIPVPPLPVQEEIVHILDTFTGLTAELTAELTARKKQYEFYRDHLLKVNNEGTTTIRLGDAGKIYGGLTGKSKDDFKDGNAKFITYKNVYSNIALNTDPDETVKIYSGEKQNTLKYGDIVFTGSSETIDECGFSSVVTKEPNENLYLNSFCFFYRFDDLNIIYPDYAKYLFRSLSMRKKIIKSSQGVTRFNVSKKRMENISITLSPLKIQKKIADALNNFDAVCNDLKIGLPAEIEARKKQYEYYRDKLLSFKELDK